MSVLTFLVDDEQEFALIVRGRYGREAHIRAVTKSDRPEKQRAELLSLISDILTWAREQGVGVTIDDDGLPVVRG